jgi:hypothetical protein
MSPDYSLAKRACVECTLNLNLALPVDSHFGLDWESGRNVGRGYSKNFRLELEVFTCNNTESDWFLFSPEKRGYGKVQVWGDTRAVHRVGVI